MKIKYLLIPLVCFIPIALWSYVFSVERKIHRDSRERIAFNR